MKAGFRKAHMRAFCYSICDINYKQMRLYAYALYRISQKQSMESIYRFIAAICRANIQSLLMFNRRLQLFLSRWIL